MYLPIDETRFDALEVVGVYPSTSKDGDQWKKDGVPQWDVACTHTSQGGYSRRIYVRAAVFVLAGTAIWALMFALLYRWFQGALWAPLLMLGVPVAVLAVASELAPWPRARLGTVPEGEPSPVSIAFADKGMSVTKTDSGGTQYVRFDYLPETSIEKLLSEAHTSASHK